MYGNDAEIFDFRPGRYHTEASLAADGEGRWTEGDPGSIRLVSC